MTLAARTIIPGEGTGEALTLTAPLSLWGGVDPVTGTIVAGHHPERGVVLTGRVLLIERLVGSSSSAAIMLELIRNCTAPAAVVLGSVDAILAIGALVGTALDYSAPPIVLLEPWPTHPPQGQLRVTAEGPAHSQALINATPD
ncbi:MAG: DUF126 domain-containing protein [Pseudomonadota bacterium]